MYAIVPYHGVPVSRATNAVIVYWNVISNAMCEHLKHAPIQPFSRWNCKYIAQASYLFEMKFPYILIGYYRIWLLESLQKEITKSKQKRIRLSTFTFRISFIQSYTNTAPFPATAFSQIHFWEISYTNFGLSFAPSTMPKI